MATQNVYPIGTSGVAPYNVAIVDPNGYQWGPSSGGDSHHLLVDEDPPNETDYIQVSGFSGGLVERLVMSTGTPSSIVAVTSLRILLHINTTNLANTPALRVNVYRRDQNAPNGSVLLARNEFQCDTSGVWGDVAYTISPLNIPANTWYSSNITIELIPIDGNAGYLPAVP